MKQSAMNITHLVGEFVFVNDIYRLVTGEDWLSEEKDSRLEAAGWLALTALPVSKLEKIVKEIKAGNKLLKGVALSAEELKILNEAGYFDKAIKVENVDKVSKVENVGKVSKLNFRNTEKLESHFLKHGGEFGGTYSNAAEYLAGANDVIKNGTKVQYNYKGELRTGYVKFMKNSSLTNPKGVPIKSYAKFEFVGTNNLGEITTYHVESGKTFWKMLNNNKNIPVINPVE
ncbi:pre-toxin TG domain-containing protein [Bacillus sp. 105MF]|uniref:pre-toxin TG domain-containing protein n=1 Tax=Bacillus sp. 105MF TaxID=1151120 RepID=UPI0018CB069D|nr:pre-toxin TG domain-containing protein [Bacillus sp. 105MF]